MEWAWLARHWLHGSIVGSSRISVQWAYQDTIGPRSNSEGHFAGMRFGAEVWRSSVLQRLVIPRPIHEEIHFTAQPLAGIVCGACGTFGHYRNRCHIDPSTIYCEICASTGHTESMCWIKNPWMNHHKWATGEDFEGPRDGWCNQ